mgnify:CR=1 FL=1
MLIAIEVLAAIHSLPNTVVFESGRVEIYVNPELGVGSPTRHGGVGSSTERKWRERRDSNSRPSP